MAHKETDKEILGLTRITKMHIQKLCKKDKLYQTPELNDVLYLHYQGFDCIECLEDYTELKCLWLECNAISEIQGLNKQTKLKCLFLQSNLIRKIENLDYCKELDTLNLSQNHIRKIENCGFDILPALNTLNLASNYLKDCEGLKALADCKNLSVLDVSNNRIDDILVVKVFSQMPELKVLVLQGNPVVSKIPQYRKTLILECEKLTYLDSRPIFPKDRACAEAWKRGGYAEERKENERWNRRERKKMRDSVNATICLRNKHRKLDDQISFIPSSDSEDEAKSRKKNIKINLHSEANIDGIWDEVADDQNFNENSNNCKEDQQSDDSSSTSESSEKEPEAKDTTIKETDNIAIMKPGAFEMSDLSVQKELKEQKEFSLQTNFAEFEEVVTHEQCEAQNKTPKVLITIMDCNDNQCTEPKRNSSQNDLTETNYPGSGQEAHNIYASAFESVEQISVPSDFSKSPLELSVEECESIEENTNDNYEIFKELEETMNIFSQEVKHDQSAYKCEEKEETSQRKLENSRECLKINNQLKTDFEELSTNMSTFLRNVQKEQEEGQDDKNALLCKEKSATESSSDENPDNEENNVILKSKLDCLTDRCDNQTKIKNTEINEHFNVNLPNYPGMITTFPKVVNYKGHQMDTPSDGKETVVNLNYIPMDISSLTRKSNEALASLEKESQILKTLLNKLETKNENLFSEKNVENKSEKKNEDEDESSRNFESFKSVDDEHDLIFKQTIEEEILQSDSDFYSFQNKTTTTIEETVKNGHTEVEQVVAAILEEIIQSLDNIASKQNSFQFPQDITEDNEDLNVITDLTKPEKIYKTIPEVIKSFNQLINEIVDKQKTNETFSDNRKKLCLKELSQRPNLKQFNTDTLPTLNAQLEEMRKKQHKKVRRMVDRVYAQKDRYNDTLELSDNKLMVRHQTTNELHELSKPPNSDTSNSEDAYDTAQSDADETTEQKFNSYKSKPRKSSEELLFKAFTTQNEKSISSDESEESTDDEFYSLDVRNKASIDKIDKELFKNLNFDLSNLSQQDENHVMQCTSSYEELKPGLALNMEEKKLLANMNKRKCEKSNAETSLKEEEQF